MIERHLTPTLQNRLERYPAVALVGPRQSGKTTLARSLSSVYYDLEQEPERLRLDLEWSRVVEGDELVVLDEAQAWPEVFPRLRGAIDADRKRFGRFLLLGSISPALMAQVSESLAGRLSLVELTPLLWQELNDVKGRERLWLCGGFPDGGVLHREAFPQWQRDYLTLLIQRDLPNWGLPAKPQTTERLLYMLAAVHGQIWNATKMGQSLGLSYHTVNDYLDYLIGAFLVRRLQPYQANLGKRLTKSPKLYWRDSGAVHSLLNVSDDIALLRQPWVGASWEGFVIEQLIGHLAALGRSFQPYFFRAGQQELDFLLDLEGELWAFEIKLTASPTSSDLSRLERVADLIEAPRRFLISQTPQPAGDEWRGSYDLGTMLQILGQA